MEDLIIEVMENVEVMNKHCCFNEMVDCSVHKCGKCGWNPDIAAKRVKNWENRREEIKNK